MPEDLDEAVKRRLEKRLYIPLPNADGRRAFINQHVRKLIDNQIAYEFNQEDIEKFITMTKGYSGADLHSLCQEASMHPI